jgi:hypothetical protein
MREAAFESQAVERVGCSRDEPDGPVPHHHRCDVLPGAEPRDEWRRAGVDVLSLASMAVRRRLLAGPIHTPVTICG